MLILISFLYLSHCKSGIYIIQKLTNIAIINNYLSTFWTNHYYCIEYINNQLPYHLKFVSLLGWQILH